MKNILIALLFPILAVAGSRSDDQFVFGKKYTRYVLSCYSQAVASKIADTVAKQGDKAGMRLFDTYMSTAHDICSEKAFPFTIVRLVHTARGKHGPVYVYLIEMEDGFKQYAISDIEVLDPRCIADKSACT